MEQRLVGKDFSQILAPGAPGVAKWMWCPKGREGVSEIPFIRAHIENGYDIVENSQHNTQTRTKKFLQRVPADFHSVNSI